MNFENCTRLLLYNAANGSHVSISICDNRSFVVVSVSVLDVSCGLVVDVPLVGHDGIESFQLICPVSMEIINKFDFSSNASIKSDNSGVLIKDIFLNPTLDKHQLKLVFDEFEKLLLCTCVEGDVEGDFLFDLLDEDRLLCVDIDGEFVVYDREAKSIKNSLLNECNEPFN